MSDNNVDVMGGEAVVAPEVNQPAEQSSDQVQDSGQESKAPEAVPYDRFSQVNSEKNDLKKKLEEQRSINNQLSQNVNQYLETQNAQVTQATQDPQIETVDDVMSYINKEIDNRVKPIEDQRKQETYVNNVNNFFTGDKEASGMRDQIDTYYNNLPSYRKEGIVDAVSRGDVSVLNELKHTVAMQHNNNLKNMATESVQADIGKTLSPNANKVVREQQASSSSLIAKGKKEGNFGEFFSQFIKDNGLG